MATCSPSAATGVAIPAWIAATSCLTVTGIQSVITFFMLGAASLMITGGKPAQMPAILPSLVSFRGGSD